MEKIVAFMRVKNEERFLGATLRSIEPLCQAIFLLDGGSTDRTPEIAKTCPKVRYWLDVSVPFDETRDFNKLYDAFKASGIQADWILFIDGDEELEPAAPDILGQALPKLPKFFNLVRVAWLSMYGDKRHYCSNNPGKGTQIRKNILLRVGASPSMHLDTTKKIDCRFPTDFRQRPFDLDLVLKHYGWMDQSCLRKRFEAYKRANQVGDPCSCANIVANPAISFDAWRESLCVGKELSEYRARSTSEWKCPQRSAIWIQLAKQIIKELKAQVKKWA